MPRGGALRFDELLQLLKADSELRPVKVVMLKDELVLLPDGPLSARKGDEIEVPRWVARLLVDRGSAKVKEEVDVNYINMYHYKERRSESPSQLSQLPPDFYVRVGEYLRSLDEAIKRSPSHMLINDRDVSEKNLIELSQVRLTKIIRLAQSESQEDPTASMTPEETLIYSKVREIVAAWRGYMQLLTKGGGSA